MKTLIIFTELAYGNERTYNEPLAEGAHRSSMPELTTWTIWADKVITF